MQRGSSALLKEGDTITIYDLLLGMNLPSGNDAATCLAEYFGEILILNKPNPRPV